MAEIKLKINSRNELEPLYYGENNLYAIQLEHNVNRIIIRIPKKMSDYYFQLKHRINDGKIGLYSKADYAVNESSKDYDFLVFPIYRNMTFANGILFIQLEWYSLSEDMEQEQEGKTKILGLTIYKSLSIEEDYEPDVFLFFEERINKIIRDAKKDMEALAHIKVADEVIPTDKDKVPTSAAVAQYLTDNIGEITYIDGGQ